MESLPRRKKIRLEKYDYSSPGGYFLTICTSERRNYFWKDTDASDNTVGTIIDRPQDIELSPYGKIVDDAINNIPNVYPSLDVDCYVIMPDHIHILVIIHADEYGRPMVAPTVPEMVRQFKGYVTKRIGRSVWQKRFFDHIIRNREDYEKHIKYIYDNPMRLQYGELYSEYY